MLPFVKFVNQATGRRTMRAALLLGVMLVTAALLAGCGDDFAPMPTPTRAPTRTPTMIPTRPPTATPAPKPTATPYPLLEGNVGQPVEAGKLILVVNSVISPTVDAKTGPAAGNRFVVLDLAIQNTGDTAVPITVSREMVLKDSTDQIYKVSARAVAAVRGATPDVNLAPGERIVAQVGYEVPLSATGLVFTFSADRFGTGKVFVQLPDGPAAGAQP